MWLKDAWSLCKETFGRWYDARTFRLAAALAYYTVFSLAPIVVVAVAVASLVFGHAAAEEHFAREIGAVVGQQVGNAILEVARNAGAQGHGLVATVVSLVVLLLGATSVFVQLQDALNTVWGVQPDPNRSWLRGLADRFLSFAIVLSLGFLLLVSLVLTATLSALSGLWTPTDVPGGTLLWQAINWVVSFALITLLFAMIFKVLPDVKIAWRDVWMGAVVTALLFNIGKYLIGLYLGQSGLASTYGAAASLVVILVWVFYSAQILLFGAHFTYVHAQKAGMPIVPARHAIPLHEEDRLVPRGETPRGTAAREGAQQPTP